MEIKDRLGNAKKEGETAQLELELETDNDSIDLNNQIIKFREKTGQEFTSFYRKYLPKLIYYTRKYCRDEDEASDYAEESFIAALEKIDTYDKEKAGFSTWLFTIARNHVFQNIKKKKRLPTVSMDTPVDDEGTTIKEFISSDELESEAINDRHSLNMKKAEIMMKSIEMLKSPYKTVIKMREIEKMSYKDIASKLGKDVIFNLVVDEGGKVKLPKEISKAYEVVDNNGNEANYTLIDGDTKKTPFYTHIELDKGNYQIKGRLPKNLSTVKSQIRNGRIKLQNMVEEDFKKLDDMYL